MTPQDVETPKELDKSKGRDLVNEVDDSMTPPLSIRATSIPGEDDVTENALKVAAAAPKKNEWDMFAEQDLDSNFDVSNNSATTAINQCNIVNNK